MEDLKIETVLELRAAFEWSSTLNLQHSFAAESEHGSKPYGGGKVAKAFDTLTHTHTHMQGRWKPQVQRYTFTKFKLVA